MKIGVVGCAGRMGQMLIKSILKNEECELSGGTEHKNSPFVGKTIADVLPETKSSQPIFENPVDLFKVSDVVLDFTTPESTLNHAKIASQTGKALIIGTTGLNDVQTMQLKEYAKNCVIVFAPNMSVGVNLLLSLVKKTAETLGISYDIDIVEMHHRNKVDAPSGTALGLGKAAAKGRNVNLEDVACYERYGQIGARPAGEIGFATLRGGDVVGDHTVIFAGDGERVELTHKASSREVFANGAVRAGLWANGKAFGLYSMQDVLGLN